MSDDVHELRDHLIEVIDGLPASEYVIVTKDGLPVAVLVDYELYQEMMAALDALDPEPR